MIDIFVNPQSISYGTKKSIDIYKLFDKLSKLFRHKAKKQNKRIEIRKEGGYVPNSMCYESIELIPIILLDNAIKYSTKGSEIGVTLSSSQGLTTVSISSYGIPVPIEERDSLFTKFFRGSNATRSSANGLGVGLWIVKKVLEAHSSIIFYHTTSINSSNGTNTFEFSIPTIPLRR